jgi:hypothetical protein
LLPLTPKSIEGIVEEEKHYMVLADYAINSVLFTSLEFKRDKKKIGAAS